jgi:HEAT repeat protein
MAKTRGVEAKLARLRTLRSQSASPDMVGELRKALDDASNLVAAEAAEIIGDKNLVDLLPELVTAFERFLIEPEKSDKLCRAKNAIAIALNKIDYDETELFLRGIRHVQLEPVWGGEQDTAAALRGNCAFALVRIGYPDVLLLLVDLLADPEKVARVAAAQALAASGAFAAMPLLRLKARLGDKEPEVTVECLTALVSLTPKESLAFVAEFLHDHDESVQAGAAFALAESRLPEAWPLLKDFWPHVSEGPLQEVVLLAMSTLRLPAAIDFLLELVAGKDQPAARAALSALAIHRHNERIRERIAAAVAQNGDAALRARFEQKYGANS